MTASRPPTDDERVTELVAECLERREREGERAVDAVCAAHPELETKLRRRLALLADAGVMDAQLTLEVPERLGDFRIVRPLGGGGMGMVYLARQEQLGRDVALKVVRPEHLYFPGTRERFRREVETIARLQHPGIVSIHAVGEEGGVPYFAMELVRGKSLEAALDRLRGRTPAELVGADLAPEPGHDDYLYRGAWPAACARVVRQVAEALEHAHQQGVLHRDIKPSNVMLASDGPSRALLLDFGLATSDGAEKLTRSGAQLGTLHYMSPEQTRGDAAGLSARSDVYSLGVTLYELLTLQRPFQGRSEHEILSAIQHGKRRPVRELNPQVSRDLETVCLTAMEVEPARRYASAADFARDLSNVLERRPIDARPTSTFVRAARWARRHPAGATALTLGAVLIVGGPSLYAWQQARGAERVREERDRAESSLRQAREAIDRMLTRLSEDELRFEPHLQKLRATLLGDAVELLERLLATTGRDERLRRDAADANARLGTMLGELGRYPPAVQALRSAITAYESLPDDLARAEGLADAHQALTAMVDVLADWQTADAQHAESRAVITELARRWPQSSELASTVIAEQVQYATMLTKLERAPEAERVLRAALATQERALAAAPGDVQLRHDFATVANEFGFTRLASLEQGERDVETEQWLERSIVMLEASRAENPRHAGIAEWLGTARINFAGALRRAEQFERALELYRTACSDLAAFLVDFPDTHGVRFQLATAYNQIGVLEDTLKHYAPAAEAYRAACERFEEIVRRYPENHMVLNRFGASEMSLSVMLEYQKLYAEALAPAERAIAAQRRALELSDEPMYRGDLANSHRAAMRAELGLRDWRRALGSAEGMTDTLPESWPMRTRAAAAYALCLKFAAEDTTLADDERERLADEWTDRAVLHLRAAIEHGMEDPGEIREVSALDPLRGRPAFEALLAELP